MVYFIQCGKSGPVKIGATKCSFKVRLAGLQVGCPFKLNLIGVIEKGYTEKELHKRFSKYKRRRGEWFSPSPEIIGFIEDPPIKQRNTRGKKTEG